MIEIIFEKEKNRAIALNIDDTLNKSNSIVN